jgi:hypothetical protein
MKFIIKNPDAWTLYKEVTDPAISSVMMTDDEFASWVAEEKARDWMPAPVTPLQMRRALRALNLRESVESAAQAAGPEVMDAWDYALEVRRDNPLLVGMAAQLGITDDQLDALFSLASTL